MLIHVYKLCRSHRKMNIWSDRCAWSNYRCAVFMQPPPQQQQHLHPSQPPPQELGLSQALCPLALSPSNASISLHRHLSLEQWHRSEPLIPAPCCRGNGVLAARLKQACWTRHYGSTGTKKLILCQVLIMQNN